MREGGVEFRDMTPDDEPAVLEVLQASLGWIPDDDYAAFYRWKHLDNPFGPSLGWVATDADRVVGVRLFLRWRFERGPGREPVDAVRAVDTATAPEYQGRGIFSRLTEIALEDLARREVAFVFNTPNEKSLPGYLKLAWTQVGRLRVNVRPRPSGLPRLLRARQPADKWSVPSGSGRPATEVLADEQLTALAIDRQRTLEPNELRTCRSAAYLSWRYRFPSLHYRAMCGRRGDGTDGLVIYRTRKRGAATEVAITEVLAASDHDRDTLVRRVCKDAKADYGITLSRRPALRSGLVPLPRLGPILTWRHVTEQVAPPLQAWNLTLGDIELF